MAFQKGLELLLKRGSVASGVTVTGLTNVSMSINNEIVDVTNKGSNRYRELLSGAGVKSMTISATGNSSDESDYTGLRSDSITGNIETYSLFYDDGATIEGMFQITSFENAGDYNNQETYSITLESSGEYTYTP